MRKKILVALVLGALLAMPSMLYAEEVEITLTEVISLNPLPGDDPLDTLKNNGNVKDKYFMITDNGTTTAPTYRPYMRKKNFWNLHYGLTH